MIYDVDQIANQGRATRGRRGDPKADSMRTRYQHGHLRLGRMLQ